MKRFLSLLTVFVLAFSLVVPASASNADDKVFVDLNGNITPNFNSYRTSVRNEYGYMLTNIFLVDAYPMGVYLYMTDGDVVYDGELIRVTGHVHRGWYDVGFVEDPTSWNFVKLSDDSIDRSVDPSVTPVLWSLGNITDSSGNIYFTGSNPVYAPYCDGTACPANDDDYPYGFCDDCGMVLSLRAPSYPTYNYNGVELPLNIVYGDYEGSLIDYVKSNGYKAYIYEGDSYVMRLFNGSLAVDSTDDRFITTSTGGDQYVFFLSDDGSYWSYNNTVSFDADSTVVNKSNVHWANFDIVNPDGSTFVEGDENFQIPPLSEMVIQLAGGELLTVAMPTLAGVMKILTVCGVGCLALLAVLKLFGKRSLIFPR